MSDNFTKTRRWDRKKGYILFIVLWFHCKAILYLSKLNDHKIISKILLYISLIAFLQISSGTDFASHLSTFFFFVDLESHLGFLFALLKKIKTTF